MSPRALSSIAIAALVAGAACGETDDRPVLTVAAEETVSPAGPNSGEPFLATDGDVVYMSWIEAAADGGHLLRLARYDEMEWSAAQTIERSERFFVNWADFPSITVGGGGSLWAHWLEKGGQSTYDYAVRIVRSEDGGASWSAPQTLHEDDSPSEHGFVSTVVTEAGIRFSWLDGRETAAGSGGDAHSEPPAGPRMTLRTRIVAADGSMAPEYRLDGRVCDCCQTASAMTSEGPIIAYRDRRLVEDAGPIGEIRDIYVARQVDGEWRQGQPVHDDGWEIAGCPVNGPAMVADERLVAVAWFTGAGEVARTKVAFSTDAGATFGPPVVVDDGNPGGRMDLVLVDESTVWVSWLERTAGEVAEVRVRRVSVDGDMSQSVTAVRSSAARASGFPRMVAAGDGAVLLAWTDVGTEEPRVRVTKLQEER